MYVYTVYKYQIDWELTPFSFLRGAAFAGGSLKQIPPFCSPYSPSLFSRARHFPSSSAIANSTPA